MRIESSELQFHAYIVVRHEAFIPCAIAAILVIGGIAAALFATRVPLSVSISVSAGLLLSYTAVMLTLIILRKQYFDNEEDESQATRNYENIVEAFAPRNVAPQERDAFKKECIAERKEEIAARKKENASPKLDEKKQPTKQEEVKRKQLGEDEIYLNWLTEHKKEIDVFVSNSINKFFVSPSAYNQLDSMVYKPKGDSPDPLPAASMTSSVVVLKYTLPTGQTVPCFAVRFLDIHNISGKSKKGPLVYTAILYPCFCFPKNRDRGLKMEWDWTDEQGWINEGTKLEKDKSAHWLQSFHRFNQDNTACPSFVDLMKGTQNGKPHGYQLD